MLFAIKIVVLVRMKCLCKIETEPNANFLSKKQTESNQGIQHYLAADEFRINSWVSCGVIYSCSNARDTGIEVG